MSEIEHVSVTVQDDFLERQTCASPIAALAELIWNSLDGEAQSVSVEFEHADLAGGLSKSSCTITGWPFPGPKPNNSSETWAALGNGTPAEQNQKIEWSTAKRAEGDIRRSR